MATDKGLIMEPTLLNSKGSITLIRDALEYELVERTILNDPEQYAMKILNVNQMSKRVYIAEYIYYFDQYPDYSKLSWTIYLNNNAIAKGYNLIDLYAFQNGFSLSLAHRYFARNFKININDSDILLFNSKTNWFQDLQITKRDRFELGRYNGIKPEEYGCQKVHSTQYIDSYNMAH
jgi:hypothetical protein